MIRRLTNKGSTVDGMPRRQLSNDGPWIEAERDIDHVKV